MRAVHLNRIDLDRSAHERQRIKQQTQPIDSIFTARTVGRLDLDVTGDQRDLPARCHPHTGAADLGCIGITQCARERDTRPVFNHAVNEAAIERENQSTEEHKDQDDEKGHCLHVGFDPPAPSAAAMGVDDDGIIALGGRQVVQRLDVAP